MSHASGDRSHPRISSKVSPSIPARLPNPPSRPFIMYTRAIKASSIAPTFSARKSPSDAPRAAASITFTSEDSMLTSRFPDVSGLPSSGYISLATTSAAGADMTEAAIRCPAISGKYAIRRPTYAASTPPATVAKPPVMTTISSDIVIFSTNGLIRRGASVWPMKMFPAAHIVSAPEVPIVRCITNAIPLTASCMMPR